MAQNGMRRWVEPEDEDHLERMAPLDRSLSLLRAIAGRSPGLTLEEMVDKLGVSERTIQRMLKVLEPHFDLDYQVIDGRKHFFVPDALPWAFARPTAQELAALEVEIKGHLLNGDRARAAPLEELLNKLCMSLDSMGKQRVRPDMDRLARFEGVMPTAGPADEIASPFARDIRGAVLAGKTVRFTYRKSEVASPADWHLVPYALVRRAASIYLLAAPLEAVADAHLLLFRLDRMDALAIDDTRATRPADWSLDDWLAQDVGAFRGERHHVQLETVPSAAERARIHKFHPLQSREEREDGSVLFEFEASGLWELAWDIFTWRGEVIIHAPQELKDILREHLALAGRSVGDGVNQREEKAA